MKGKVYCFKMIGTSYYKIGMTETESINDRFNMFKTYSPNGAEIISVIETGNARLLENQLHNEFKNRRVNGEFFILDNFDIDKIKKYENEETIKLNNFFWINIKENNISFDELNKAFNYLKINNEILNENLNENSNEKIFNFLEFEWSCSWLSNNEIYKLLLDENIISNEFSKEALGRVLKIKYTQKIKKIDGITKRMYYIK